MVAGVAELLKFRPLTAGNGSLRLRNLEFHTGPVCVVGKVRYSRLEMSITGKFRSLPQTCRASGRSDQIHGYGDGNLGQSSTTDVLKLAQPLLAFASANFLPLALISGVALGLANPSLGCVAHRYGFSKFSTFGIFFISGLTLKGGDIGAAAEAWPAGIFGLSSILCFSPFFSKFIMKLQLSPQEFVTGLAIFCCMPTTLSSGVALTTLARGNSALALAMTVVSNLLGILIVPFSLSKLIAGGIGVSVPTQQLFRSLVVTLLVPLILGKVFRSSFPYDLSWDIPIAGSWESFAHITSLCAIGVAEYVDQNRKLFSNTSAILLSLVPWIQVSRSRPLLLMVKPAVFFIATVLGTLVHLILLGLNTFAVDILSFLSGHSKAFSNKENKHAVVIVSSQKTLPVMVAVVEQLGGALGEPGLLVLPCVAAHINQIIIDSFLVNFWLQKDPS
ncbi:probable sodium/metabolite cotransporter BASS4, chloroplastic isoform X1 [Aristolochia californica]|uniref:probable sodium/metabolite cotransporter BASS4, chloroplastic isoform X1 n=1 Tax=Aristolochia californica TaxID=171875 RepID=UPI0035D963FF